MKSNDIKKLTEKIVKEKEYELKKILEKEILLESNKGNYELFLFIDCGITKGFNLNIIDSTLKKYFKTFKIKEKRVLDFTHGYWIIWE